MLYISREDMADMTLCQPQAAVIRLDFSAPLFYYTSKCTLDTETRTLLCSITCIHKHARGVGIVTLSGVIHGSQTGTALK